MGWETPNTDWPGFTEAYGNYSGDRFNASDFNRIKNNIEHLRAMGNRLYREFPIVSLGDDRTPADYFYADEINQLEENFKTVNNNTQKRSYGTAPKYMDNGSTMTFTELNRLEGAILDLYNRLNHQAENRRMLVLNFGIKGGL